MSLPSSENAKNWLQTVLAIAREGGPVSLLIVVVLSAVTIYGLVGEIKRVHAVNATLWAQLLDAQKAQIALARQCAGAAPKE